MLFIFHWSGGGRRRPLPPRARPAHMLLAPAARHRGGPAWSGTGRTARLPGWRRRGSGRVQASGFAGRTVNGGGGSIPGRIPPEPVRVDTTRLGSGWFGREGPWVGGAGSLSSQQRGRRRARLEYACGGRVHDDSGGCLCDDGRRRFRLPRRPRPARRRARARRLRRPLLLSFANSRFPPLSFFFYEKMILSFLCPFTV